jgi:transglutaminase-like putative cysteine protease
MEIIWVTPTQPEILELAETKMGLNNTSDYGAAYLIAMEVYNNLFRERLLYKENILTKKLPAEVLRENEGDCDEISGLYASVLEVLGIETKKVNIPGHQYMLIKLGEYWKGFDPTVQDYRGDRVLADFQFSLELGEDEYKDVDENTSIYSPREEWAKGLRKAVIP